MAACPWILAALANASSVGSTRRDEPHHGLAGFHAAGWSRAPCFGPLHLSATDRGQLFSGDAKTAAVLHITNRAPDLMLNCRACLWRCIQPLDVPATTNVRRLGRNVNPLAQGQRRLRHDMLEYRTRHAQTISHREGGRKESEAPSPSYAEDSFRTSAFAANRKKREIAALRETPARYETPNLAKLGPRDPRISDSDWNRRKRELRHLQDPLDLATFVKKELSKGKVEEMLQLVRMACHSMQCIVSWNHIIDHQLANGRINDAFKVYNEVWAVRIESGPAMLTCSR